MLEALKEADKRHTIQGSARHQYACGPLLREEILKDFEKTHGVCLPCEYREHLLHAGDGSPHVPRDHPIQTGPGPGYGLIALDALQVHAQARLRFPSLASDAPISHERLEDECFEHWDNIPGAIEVATEGCAHQYLMVLDGPHAGSIWSYSDGCPLLFLTPSFERWMHDWATTSLRAVEQRSGDEARTLAQTPHSKQGNLARKLRRWWRSAER